MISEPERIVIRPEAADTSMARRVTRWARSRGIPVEQAAQGEGVTRHAAPDLGASSSKGILLLALHRGAVLKACTGRTGGLLCCNLRVLTQVVGCPLDCSYCVLQSYQNRGVITVGANTGEILRRLRLEGEAHPRRLLRVCTGQVGDSLALEPELGFAARAVEEVAGSPNLVLELKTKTADVEPFLGLDHGGRTILSWSLSPDQVAAQEEHGCAPTAARIAAAARAAEDGYMVAFHLDPMIPGETAQEEQELHADLLSRALEAVPAEQVVQISLGSVRFPPTARRTLLERWPSSRATLGELLPEADGKLRLLTPRRIRLYRAVAEVAVRRCPEAFLYLCMEPARVWRKALGSSPASNEEVEFLFASSLHRRYGLAPVPPTLADYPPDNPRD